MHEKRSDGSLARADAAHSGAAETAKARRTRGAGLGRSGSGWESGSGDDWHGEAGVPVDPVRVDVVWDRLLVEARPVLGVEELSAVSESGSSLKESPVGLGDADEGEDARDEKGELHDLFGCVCAVAFRRTPSPLLEKSSW